VAPLFGRDFRWAAVTGGLALLLASCSSPEPAPSVTATPGQPTASPVLPSPSDAPPITWHFIDPSLTSPLLATASTDSEILWSAGPDAPGKFAPDLYRYTVATGDVERVVRSQNRRANLLPIAGSPSGYAYVEEAVGADDVISWKLWFLSSDASNGPIVLDKMDSMKRPTPAPTLAIDDHWLVWGSVHERRGRAMSELAIVDLRSFQRHILASVPASNATFWFPSLDGDSLVYNKLVTRPTVSSQVFFVDLPARRPGTRLDTSGDAAMPGISRDWVIWKRNPDNPFDWGRLARHSLASGNTTPFQLGDEPEANYPSVGSRYVAAWELESTTFYVYDLEDDKAVVIEALQPDAEEANVRPAVHGQLLTWVHVLPGDQLQLRWAQLPN
jgi:hypothetical protein